MPHRCYRSSISDEYFILSKVSNFSIMTQCDCGDEDLNDFFHKEAVNYKKDLLTETYSFFVKGQRELKSRRKNLGPFAFVALSNDLIKLSDTPHIRKIPYNKRYIKEYPAVKIARLGVHVKFQRHGMGTYLINLLKALFTTNNRTGCRFLTVDAYNREPAIAFYKKNEFDFLHDKDANDKTRIMFYDLKRFVIPKT